VEEEKVESEVKSFAVPRHFKRTSRGLTEKGHMNDSIGEIDMHSRIRGDPVSLHERDSDLEVEFASSGNHRNTNLRIPQPPFITSTKHRSIDNIRLMRRDTMHHIKADAPNSINTNTQSLAFEYKRALKSLIKQMDMRNKYIEDVELIKSQNLISQYSAYNLFTDLESFHTEPISWESRLLVNKYGTSIQNPAMQNSNQFYYFAECDGYLRINHGIIFGYLSLFNMSYAPIRVVHEYIQTTQQHASQVSIKDLIQIFNAEHNNANDMTLSAKSAIEQGIFYSKLFYPLQTKKFDLEYRGSY